MKYKERYNNYDLLRCLCIIGVFWLHSYHSTNTDVLYRTITFMAGMAVPLFIMMSGALVLKESGGNVREWYRKTLSKVGIPWLLGTVLYIGLNWCFQFLYYLKAGEPMNLLIDFEHLWKYGITVRGWHLWYMLTFFMLYLLVPFIKWIKNVSYHVYVTVGVVFYIVALMNWINTNYYFEFINYLGYFILGDIILSHSVGIKKKICMMVAAFFLVLSFVVFGLWGSSVNPGAIATVSIFVIFTCIKVKVSLYPISKYILYAYILHIAVGTVISGVINFLTHKYYFTNPLLDVLVMAISSFGVSYLLSVMFDKLSIMMKKR